MSNLPTSIQREAMVIYEAITRAIALAGMYPHASLDLCEDMLGDPRFGTREQRDLAIDFLTRARALED